MTAAKITKMPREISPDRNGEPSRGRGQNRLDDESASIGVIAPDEQLPVASSPFGAGRAVTPLGGEAGTSTPTDPLFAYTDTAPRTIDAGDAPYDIDIRLDARQEDERIIAEIPGQTLVVGGYRNGTLHLPDDWGFADGKAVLTVTGFGGDDKISSSAVRIAGGAKQAMIQAHVDQMAGSAKTAQDLVTAERQWLEAGEISWCVIGRTTYVFDKVSVVALNGITMFDPSSIELTQHRSGLLPAGYLADLDVMIAGAPFEGALAAAAVPTGEAEISPVETVGTLTLPSAEMPP